MWSFLETQSLMGIRQMKICCMLRQLFSLKRMRWREIAENYFILQVTVTTRRTDIIIPYMYMYIHVHDVSVLNLLRVTTTCILLHHESLHVYLHVLLLITV